MTAKTPQDRRPKATTAAGYAFTVTKDGKPQTHLLPPAATVADKISGKFLRDAYMDGTDGQMRLGFAMLELVDAEPEAIEALYAMPAPEMIEHIGEWMDYKPSEEDASLGESSSSSD